MAPTGAGTDPWMPATTAKGTDEPDAHRTHLDTDAVGMNSTATISPSEPPLGPGR